MQVAKLWMTETQLEPREMFVCVKCRDDFIRNYIALKEITKVHI